MSAGLAKLEFDVRGSPNDPVLVLSNSLGTVRSVWDEQLETLERHFQVVTYDHRGHGRSEVLSGPYSIDDFGRDLMALLDSLQIDRFNFAGLSLGGIVGMWIATHYRSRLDKLVLLSAGAYQGPADMWIERAYNVRAKGMEVVSSNVAERWFSDSFRNLNSDRVKIVVDQLAKMSPEGYASSCEAISTVDFRDELVLFDVPVLVVVGNQDVILPVKVAQEIVEALPNGSYLEIDRAGHILTIEQPDEIARCIVDFVKG